MDNASFPESIEAFLATLARLYAADGSAREVAILAVSKPRVEETDYDNWDGGTYGYSVYLEVPMSIYSQINDDKDEIERGFVSKASPLMVLYPQQWLRAFYIIPEVSSQDGWREKAMAWVSGKNVTNQGRVRSDNIASRSCDGLLFRSQAEIHFYNALKSLGVSFAPLPVFLRGGKGYRRIEPDFYIVKDNVSMVVEIDGDTVHHETPAEAHDRTTILLHEGVYFERLLASDCSTAEKAVISAIKIMSIISKYKDSK